MRALIIILVGFLFIGILTSDREQPEPELEPVMPAMPESVQDEREAERSEIAATRSGREVSEPTTTGPALERLNTASDRVDAALAEMDRTCAPPTNDVEALASAKCIGRVLAQVCPDIGEGALNDMSAAARDMEAREASWAFEQAAMDCWNAVFYSDLPNGGVNPRRVGASVTRMGEKIREASALLR